MSLWELCFDLLDLRAGHRRRMQSSAVAVDLLEEEQIMTFIKHVSFWLCHHQLNGSPLISRSVNVWIFSSLWISIDQLFCWQMTFGLRQQQIKICGYAPPCFSIFFEKPKQASWKQQISKIQMNSHHILICLSCSSLGIITFHVVLPCIDGSLVLDIKMFIFQQLG